MAMAKGNRYVIRNQTLSGKPIVEGTARLRQFIATVPATPDEVWQVEFDSEPGQLFQRVVLAGDWKD